MRRVLTSRSACPYDLVINGTSAGLAGQSLPIPGGILADDACCYDMAYGTGGAGISGLGREATARRCVATGWACWWNRPLNPSTSGAASARKRKRS